MRNLKYSVALFCFVVMLPAPGCRKTDNIKLESVEFRNPPVSSSVHAWWHWMENAITKEGITRDLEAMKKQGISTATILNVSLFSERNLGVQQVIFNTPEWLGMFDWALNEAKRLGMTLGVHNCDGWSTSGGPWIGPEYSMKQCTWSKSFITGGRTIEMKLPQPHGKLDFYRDIRVIAIPSAKGISSFQAALPVIKVNSRSSGTVLCDANPLSAFEIRKGTEIDFYFEKEFAVFKIAIHPRIRFAFVSPGSVRFKFELRSSADGQKFRNIREFDGPALNRSTVLETQKAVKSRHFKVVITELTGIESMELGEIELLSINEKPAYQTSIPFHLEKTVTTMSHSIRDFRVHGMDSTGIIPLDEVIDLTHLMDTNGNLRWNAPAGSWEILRLGYTTTGVQNFPATKAGTGLECDKMDTAALNRFFNGFSGKLIARASEHVGKTFEYIFIDSWECGFQNWSNDFKQEFEKRRKYSMTGWLPVICGVTIESPEATERFIHDYQKTIAELIEENYYVHYDRLCRQNGIKLHAEVIYGGGTYPPLDVLKSNSFADVPMYEFWANSDDETDLVNYTPGSNPAYSTPAFAAALYGKKVVPAEAYTGYAHFSESPWDLKLFGDRAYCTGINQMVLHSYVHQPSEQKPGITLWEFGHSFNRHNPWWDFSSQWFTYQARIQNVLQRGVPTADILYYGGDRFYPGRDNGDMYQIPEGYRMQKCNLDVLMNHCTIKDGKIRLDNGLSYGLLLLHNDVYMNPETLQRIAELVREGAVVAGTRPSKVPGNLDYDGNEKLLNDLASEMWGSENNGSSDHAYGKGRVIFGKKMTDILDDLKISPEFSSDGSGESLLYIHKKIGREDVFFVINQEDVVVERKCMFRITGESPEIWNPQYGTMFRLKDFIESNGIITVKQKFQPRESLFFVFRDGKNKLPEYKEYEQNYVLVNFEGMLKFEELPGKASLSLKNFSSWTESEDPDIKYYSGKAIYSLKFDLPEEIAGKQPLFLCLDQVKSVYEIKLNGIPVGSAVFPGYRFDVSQMINEQENLLEVSVATPYRNKIIGDLLRYGSLQNLWTTLPPNGFPGKDKPLLESGILGPVKFYY